ncbi:MAG: hypothetical protein IIA67_08115 [Planctomycetes bacterium]|nr:hypothetical protein [Planctomycetota bacterium]
MKMTKTLVPLLAVTAILVSAAPIQAGIIFNGFTPFTSVVEDCNGDMILLDGELHDVISQRVDQAGRLHLHVLSHPAAIEGVNLTDGTRYIGVGANTFSLNVVLPNGDGTVTQVVQIVLIGENGQTLVMLAQFKVTIADGQVRVFFDRITNVVCP